MGATAMANKKSKNPFYVLLLVVGTMFALTASAYGVMTVRMSHPHVISSGDRFFDAYGMWIMAAELTVLTLLTFAAIATDDYWTRGAAGAAAAKTRPAEETEPNG